MIVDPWGVVLAQAPDAETRVVADLDLDGRTTIRTKLPVARQPPAEVYAWLGGPRLMAVSRAQAAADKRRADPRRRRARVRPPGLPHLPRLGHRRRGGGRLRPRLPLLRLQGRDPRHALPRALGRHARGDRRDRPPRARSRRARSCYAIASFIVDSYRHDPELMKVIIVEVTRAANSFGRTHLAKIREAYDADRARSSSKAQADGDVQVRRHARVRRDGLLRRDRAGADRLDLRPPPDRRGRVRAGQALRGRDHVRRVGGGGRRERSRDPAE